MLYGEKFILKKSLWVVVVVVFMTAPWVKRDISLALRLVLYLDTHVKLAFKFRQFKSKWETFIQIADYRWVLGLVSRPCCYVVIVWFFLSFIVIYITIAIIIIIIIIIFYFLAAACYLFFFVIISFLILS